MPATNNADRMSALHRELGPGDVGGTNIFRAYNKFVVHPYNTFKSTEFEYARLSINPEDII